MRAIIFLLVVNLLNSADLIPCTTAVVSGRGTTDGRPLLLKNRDADALQNRLVYFNGAKFQFVGLVNSQDLSNSEVWCGFNSAGLGIMNSVSYNIKGNDTSTLADQEGFIMKMALGECGSLEDFEALLNRLPKPLGVEANFGLIDAHGGAAYYEVNNFHFIKYDVNNPAVAPNGYLIRTNFSFAGAENQGQGYIRYSTASDLFKKEFKSSKISARFLIGDVPRCLVHSFTKQDLCSRLPEENDSSYVFFRDYIPRYYTSSAVVVQGVMKDENPELATMWTILGFPLTSFIVPVWILDDGSLPSILKADETGNAPLCTLALRLKSRLFSTQRDASENYLKISALMNSKGTGIRQKIESRENTILESAGSMIDSWRKLGKIDKEKAKEFYKQIDNEIFPAFQRIL